MRSSAAGQGQRQSIGRRMARSLGGFRSPAKSVSAALALLLALPGCSAFQSAGDSAAATAVQGQEGFVRGFLGYAVADEPRAAVAARNVLSAGGNAADAATAAGFMMAVTLPSRAGLGGGGACLVFDPRRGATEAILFQPGARQAAPQGADRPAAVPMLARGLFALHARNGSGSFETLTVPAEAAARLGVEVSRALAVDLAAVAGPLLADPWAASVFAGPGGRPLGIGERLVQSDLGATLASLRTAGVGDLHQGAMARRVAEASLLAGGGLTVGELRASVPRVAPPLQLVRGTDTISFLPAEVPGGQASADAFAGQAPAASGVLPASAGLVVVDRTGMAVSCTFTMNNLFGTGRVAPGTGILLAAAPGIGQVRPPLLAAGIAHVPNTRAFRAAAAGSGQAAAPVAVGTALAGALRGADATAALAGVPEPGRGLLVTCPRTLPGVADSCTAAADPRGAGLALGSSER